MEDLYELVREVKVCRGRDLGEVPGGAGGVVRSHMVVVPEEEG